MTDWCKTLEGKKNDLESIASWASMVSLGSVRDYCRQAAHEIDLAIARLTITEGPFWAVMLPDGKLLLSTGDDAAGPMLWITKPEWPLDIENVGRVVRVRSVTYEVEVE